MTQPDLKRLTRRQFNRSALAVAAAAGGSALAAPAILRGRNLNDKLNIAIIGAGGRGAADTQEVASENIVALCDVNAHAVQAAARKHPDARTYSDFRKLFDRPEGFDAVVVATCEHTHAMATMLAIRHGKHVYCEKPLTHDVWEARQIRLAASKAPGVVTQMGIQIHATENYRRVVEIVRSGAIGPVREAHVWVSRAWGLQSAESAKRNRDIVYVTDRPAEAETPPDWLDWDLWLGPAPQRPFNRVYVPGPRWYRWWDFGNGTMSDLGSHFNDLPFWALGLRAPMSIVASGPPPHPEIAPASMTAIYEYGPRGEGQPPVRLAWHQGEDKPQIWKDRGVPQWPDGHLFIGERGMLLSNYQKYLLLPEKDFIEFKPPAPTLPRPASHHAEWIECCKSGRQPSANFEYAGWLTEANHLGNVAYRVGRKITWDAEKMRAPDAPEADRFLRGERRQGWELS